MIIANNVAEAIEKYKVDKVFIDGVGVGGGVVDRLNQMGY
jgi:phage terminase large subunit-like protein